MCVCNVLFFGFLSSVKKRWTVWLCVCAPTGGRTILVSFSLLSVLQTCSPPMQFALPSIPAPDTLFTIPSSPPSVVPSRHSVSKAWIHLAQHLAAVKKSLSTLGSTKNGKQITSPPSTCRLVGLVMFMCGNQTGRSTHTHTKQNCILCILLTTYWSIVNNTPSRLNDAVVFVTFNLRSFEYATLTFVFDKAISLQQVQRLGKFLSFFKRMWHVG